MLQIEVLIAEIEKDLSGRQSGLEKRRQRELATFIGCVRARDQSNGLVRSPASQYRNSRAAVSVVSVSESILSQ
jgi:hypothetical protein